MLAVFAPKLGYFGALALLGIQGVTWSCRQSAQKKQGVGDEIRRRGLLLDALGPFDQSYDLTELMRKAGTSASERALTKTNSGYYASDAKDGLVRLRDHLRENSFWNRCLYLEASKRGKNILWAIGIAFALTLFLTIALASSQDAVVTATRVFILALTFLLAYTFVVDVQAWANASTAIEALERQLDGIKNLGENSLRTTNLDQMMTILSEYAVATSKIAPIPPVIYLKHRDNLNKLWNEREARPIAPRHDS
ncbi:hypothetical protein OG205_24460 [Lentzea sp. NBC_00516]|uniref:hypothetical protein n=1 Tax=Lentzea sp. NBC_00516 TaxID=2903582 RepID=UPI002E7FF59F|nr:hypothetical protein [Lentzea sp. NBC_00516]WUD21294.1 hypothetical protein OG205_24460 [Lentzea sp. NBC_00516]